MQNVGSSSFFACKIVFVSRFSKFLWHFLRLRIIRSHSARGVSERDDMQKDVVRRVRILCLF